MYIFFYVKYSLFLSDFNKTVSFSLNFRKILKFLIFMKIRPIGAELVHVDGQEDRQKDRQTHRQYDEADSRFSQFCERP